jgi:hypothetical protein
MVSTFFNKYFSVYQEYQRHFRYGKKAGISEDGTE